MNKLFWLLVLILIFSCDSRNPTTTSFLLIDQISVSKETIYADDNATFAEIEVIVKDYDGNFVEGENVHFECDLGHILTDIVTDDSGKAVSTFWDYNDVGLATITISVGDDQKTTVIMIETPVYYIESITANPETIEADDGQTYSEITVLVKYQEENPAIDKPVEFSTDLGEINPLQDSTDVVGYAFSYFYDTGQDGTATITATVDDSTKSVAITILP